MIETDKEHEARLEREDKSVYAWFQAVACAPSLDRMPAKATPTYTEPDFDDLDAEDWEYMIHRTER